MALQGCRLPAGIIKGVLSVLFQVTSPAQWPLLSQWIVDRLLRFSAVPNVPLVPSLERVLKGGQSLRPVQARVHAKARALFEVFIGAQWNYSVPLCHCCSVPLHSCFPAIINVTPGIDRIKTFPSHGASDRMTLDYLPIRGQYVAEWHNRPETYNRCVNTFLF